LEIFLNDEPIDVSIQEEKILGELVVGLKEWLSENSLIFLGLEVNGTSIEESSPSDWESMALDEVRTLHIWANHPLLIQQDQLKLLLEYTVLLGSSFEEYGQSGGKRGIEQVEEILKESPGILLALDRFFPGDSATPQELLRGFSYDTQILNENWDKYLDSCRTIELLLQSRIREYERPQDEAIGTLKTIHTLQGSLSQVSVQLQGGKVDQALLTIQHLVELLQKLARTMGLLKNHPSSRAQDDFKIQEAGETLNTLLEELVQGMENNDVVLIGDILEYELPPVFERLQSLLEDI